MYELTVFLFGVRQLCPNFSVWDAERNLADRKEMDTIINYSRESEFFPPGTDRVSERFEQDQHVRGPDSFDRTTTDNVVGIHSPSVIALSIAQR